MGVTMSCSRVPRSFSFTMEREVSTVVMIMSTMASTAGTMKFLLASVGLYSTRTAGCTCTAWHAASTRGPGEASRAAAVAAASLGDDQGGIGESDGGGLRFRAVGKKLQARHSPPPTGSGRTPAG